MLRQRTGAARLAPALVTIAAALVASAPAAAAPPMRLINRPVATTAAATTTRPLTTYGGSTSKDAPFALQVSKDHKRLVRLLVHALAPCPGGGGVFESGPATFARSASAAAVGNTLVGDVLPRNGAFKRKGLAVESYANGFTGSLSETVAGTVKGRRATGVFRMVITVRDASGAPVSTCDNGTLTWKASSVPGKVFAGLTSQRRPVVVVLSPDLSSVADFRVSWGGSCQPEGFLLIGDHMGNFPVDDSGSFGDTWDAGPYVRDDGSSNGVHYELAGRAAGTRMSGRFAARLDNTSPDGTVNATCAQAPETWSATS